MSCPIAVRHQDQEPKNQEHYGKGRYVLMDWHFGSVLLDYHQYDKHSIRTAGQAHLPL